VADQMLDKLKEEITMIELNVSKIIASEKGWIKDNEHTLKLYEKLKRTLECNDTDTEGYVLMAFIDNLYEAAFEKGYNKAEKDYEEMDC
jgi:transcriptional regulator